MRRHHVLAVLTVLLTAAAAHPSPLAAQRGPRADKPTGAEVALKARSARLDHANAAKGQFQGKPITFTPAILPPRADLAAGQVIGALENEIAGDETGLPAGKYNVFAVRLADGWHVYAESGGQIVREALDVRIVRRPGQAADKRPRIRAKGWGVDIDYSATKTLNPPPVASVAIVGSTANLLIGESRQYTIEARDASGAVLTGRSVTWTSSAPAVASTPAFGAVRGLAGGTATFTATSEGKSASVTLTVPAVTYELTYYTAPWREFTWSLPAATSQYLRFTVFARGCYYTGQGCPLASASDLTYTITAPGVASLTRMGSYSYSNYTAVDLRLSMLAEGTTDLLLNARGSSLVIHLTVTRAKAASLTVTPYALKIATGQSQQITATARDAAGAVTAAAITFTSSATSIADVTASGRVAGVSVGSATITVKADSLTTTVPVDVTPVPVAAVSVAPSPVAVEENQWAALTATPKDAAGNPLTGRTVIWSVNNPAIAEVTASGRVIGVAAGVAMVTATSESRAGTVPVTVTAPAASTTETLSFNW